MRAMLKLVTILLALVGSCYTAMASSHGGIYAYVADETGITVPPLIHGQMVVLNDYRPAILALSQSVAPDDVIASKLRTYIGKQRAACLWGLAPLALADTESPFHLCVHGYLAGTKALLMRMQDISHGGDVQALADKVEAAMLANNASLSICQYSYQEFHTAEIVQPLWQDIPAHPATLFALLLPLMILLGGSLYVLLRYLRPRVVEMA